MTNFQIAEKVCEFKFTEFAKNINSSIELIQKIKFTPVYKKYDVYFFSANTKYIAELKNISKFYKDYGIEVYKYKFLKFVYEEYHIDPLYIIFLPNGKTKVVNLNLLFENEKELKTRYWNCPATTVENRGEEDKLFYLIPEKYTTNYAF